MILLPLLILVLAPIGLCAMIGCAGWWLTLSARMTHREHMFEASEKAKLNAITIEERQTGIDTQRFKALEAQINQSETTSWTPESWTRSR